MYMVYKNKPNLWTTLSNFKDNKISFTFYIKLICFCVENVNELCDFSQSNILKINIREKLTIFGCTETLLTKAEERFSMQKRFARHSAELLFSTFLIRPIQV